MTKKLTIAERRAKIEEETKRLAIAEILREKADALIESLREDIKSAYMSYSIIGHETEQMTENGELMWKVPSKWRPVSDSELLELPDDVKEKAEPYFEAIWGDVEKAEDDLSDYDRNMIQAYSELIKALQEVDY